MFKMVCFKWEMISEMTWNCNWSVSTTKTGKWVLTGRRVSRHRSTWTPWTSTVANRRHPTNPSISRMFASPVETPYKSPFRLVAVHISSCYNWSVFNFVDSAHRQGSCLLILSVWAIQKNWKSTHYSNNYAIL